MAELKSLIRQIAAYSFITLVPAGPLFAAPAITVGADHAKVIAVAGTPAAVIVGNPMFADVSIQSGQIIVHGRNFGSTNVIILDLDGKQLAAFDVDVTRAGDRNVSVYKAGQAYSSVCAPICEYTIQTGEDADWFGSMNGQFASKAGQVARALKLGE